MTRRALFSAIAASVSAIFTRIATAGPGTRQDQSTGLGGYSDTFLASDSLYRVYDANFIDGGYYRRIKPWGYGGFKLIGYHHGLPVYEDITEIKIVKQPLRFRIISSDGSGVTVQP